MAEQYLVLGDSVPTGGGTATTPWPGRVATQTGATVSSHGQMGSTVPELAAAAPDVVDKHDGDELVVLVHAGHNDAQRSRGDPRVTLDRFRAAAASLDETLADHPAVAVHGFVGLVPLLDIDDADGVPFSDDQPDRSLAYDDALADTVTDHVTIARPVEAWRSRTADGVHPTDEGHAFVAERVRAWLDSD